jgi:hypothetical protein
MFLPAAKGEIVKIQTMHTCTFFFQPLPAYNKAAVSCQTHAKNAHTHTHTHREREREKTCKIKRNILSLLKPWIHQTGSYKFISVVTDIKPKLLTNMEKTTRIFNPFTAEVAIMRLLSSAPKSHLCDQRRRSKVTGLSDLMTLFIVLGCLYCKQTQRAFNVFKNTLNWLKIDSVDQKFNRLECGNFSQDAGTHGTERVIAFLQLAVKGLKKKKLLVDSGLN